MEQSNSKSSAQEAAAVNRRSFLLSSAKVGAGLAIAGTALKSAFAADAPTSGTLAGAPAILKRNKDELLVGVIGLGEQGSVLIEAMSEKYISNVRIKAVCDIWQWPRETTVKRFKASGILVNGYENYKDMIDKEKDLDAIVCASPDWMHAEIAIAAMEAGKHVYCEKEMSNSLEKAKQMVLAQRRTGKLLQIGHQRRSNPRYRHAVDRLIHEARMLGRVTQAYGQWNRAKQEDRGWPERYPVSADILTKYGYDSMQQFRNWRWYKKYGGGPIVDLGSHQIDIFTWVFGVNPKSVVAAGGIDFYKHHEWYDNVMTIYEYENKEGVSRAFYQVLTTTGYGGFHEVFMGEDGSILISEVSPRGNTAKRESAARPWDDFVKQGLLSAIKAPIKPAATKNTFLDVRVTAEAGSYPLPIELTKPAHTPHLQNFFDAIRFGQPLNCPAEIGYETAVAVLAVNRAVEAGHKIEFKPEEFIV
ncbi:MAG: Gfo/Idh/MocA family oxidoreductase [Candidatus Sumerlaeota bacterium]|nr:Gfo/Idh/MocA family oxidoreductase [Candidatus Sumerlaeota bacterium]